MRTVVNSILRPLDRTNQDGSVRKYISVAKHIIGSTKACIVIVCSSITKDDINLINEIVSDSGATSHMRRNRSDFVDGFITYTDVFVLMGDGSEIQV